MFHDVSQMKCTQCIACCPENVQHRLSFDIWNRKSRQLCDRKHQLHTGTMCKCIRNPMKSYIQPKRTKLDWNCDPAKSATPKGSKVGLFTALFSLQAGLLLNATYLGIFRFSMAHRFTRLESTHHVLTETGTTGWRFQNDSPCLAVSRRVSLCLPGPACFKMVSKP